MRSKRPFTFMTMILLPLYHQLMSMEYNKCRFFLSRIVSESITFFPAQPFWQVAGNSTTKVANRRTKVKTKVIRSANKNQAMVESGMKCAGDKRIAIIEYFY